MFYISVILEFISTWEIYLVLFDFKAVTRVLSCQPQNAKALYRKARILSAMGRNSEALEAAKAAAAAAPEDLGARREASFFLCFTYNI